jgi:hypothetical protein
LGAAQPLKEAPMMRLLVLVLSVVSLPAIVVAGDEVEPGRTKPVIRAPIMVAGDMSVKGDLAAPDSSLPS